MAEIVVLYSGPIVSRKNARAAGLKRYFTGKPCKHGHVAERQSRGSACVECVRLHVVRSSYDYVKEWKAKHPEKVAAANKRYAQKHPETGRKAVKRYNERHRERLLPELAAKAREKRKNDPEGERRRRLVFKARREEFLTEIAGRARPLVCELCVENNGGIVFDHCHRTDAFRGWLCDRCNKVLGLVKDDHTLLRTMAEYLEMASVKVDEQTQERITNDDVRVAGAEKISTGHSQ